MMPSVHFTVMYKYKLGMKYKPEVWCNCTRSHGLLSRFTVNISFDKFTTNLTTVSAVFTNFVSSTCTTSLSVLHNHLRFMLTDRMLQQQTRAISTQW